MQLRRFCLVLIAFAVCAAVAACGPSNSVRLLYAPGGDPLLPTAGSPRVTVVTLEDKRPQQAIGQRSNGTAFMPNSPVSDWVSRSLGAEVARLGTELSYATSFAQARKAGAPCIITGSVDEIWITESGPTRVSATIRITVTLFGADGKTLGSQTFTSSQERQALPSASLVESLLTDTLRDVLVPAAGKIQQQLRTLK